MYVSALAFLVALAVPPADTGRQIVLAADSTAGEVRDFGEAGLAGAALVASLPAHAALPAGVTPLVTERAPAADTVPRQRRRSIEVSDWYERRLRIHRYGAYTMIPLFAFQAVAGNQVFQMGDAAPSWAKTGHRVGATGLATVFGLNTVTGLWNLWDSRAVAQGRTRRTVHSLLMLASDAGFTYAGVRLSEQAETDASKRRQHRSFALGSMAAAITGAGLMVFTRD